MKNNTNFPYLKAVRAAGLGWKLRYLKQAVVPTRPYEGRKLDCFFLSMGRSGTHFIDNVVRLSSNAHSIHESGIILDEVFSVVDLWERDPEAFWSLKLESVSSPYTKIRRFGGIQCEVFTEMSNSIYPFAYMLHDYYNIRQLAGRKLKLVHLIRDPVKTCCSNIKVERYGSGEGFRRRPPSFLTGKSSAYDAARVWNKVNTLSREIVEKIDNTNIARVFRIEDLNAEKYLPLFEFLELEGYSKDKIVELLDSGLSSVRRSHVARSELSTEFASDAEIEVIRAETKQLGRYYGYIV